MQAIARWFAALQIRSTRLALIFSIAIGIKTTGLSQNLIISWFYVSVTSRVD